MNGKEKKSFILYHSHFDFVSPLSVNQRGDLLTAIFAHERGEELPRLDGETNMAFIGIRQDLDRNKEKYARICEINSENGRKGGRPPKNEKTERLLKKPNGFSEKRAKASESLCENDNKSERRNEERVKKESFSVPSVDEVDAFCKANGYSIDAQTFVDHYTSNGWMVGRSKMKDWQAAVRNWVRRQIANPSASTSTGVELLPENQRDHLLDGIL